MFIVHVLGDIRIDWRFAISPQVADVLEQLGVDTTNMYLFESSPARDKVSRDAIIRYAENEGAEMVFTMAGPAYVQFPIPHVMGISNGFITHASIRDIAFGRKLVDFSRVLLTSFYKAWASRGADFWVFQTEEARSGFCRRLRVEHDKTVVVTNAIDTNFADYFSANEVCVIDKSKVVKCLVPAASYRHKALQLIPRIAKACSDLSVAVEFILTLDDQDSLWSEIEEESNRLGVRDRVSTIGSYNYANAKTIFSNVDMVFVPSVLETFSASYLEAFASKKPLIAANKPFAKEICRDGALFVDPCDSSAVAEQFMNLIENPVLQRKLIEKGLDVVGIYGDQKQRCESIVSHLLTLCEKECLNSGGE